VYKALNTSFAILTQNASRGSNLFVPPRYNVSSHFVSTPTHVLSGGLYVPPPLSPGGSNHSGPISSNPVAGTNHFVTSSFQIPL
jgi:hypothetical protein